MQCLTFEMENNLQCKHYFKHIYCHKKQERVVNL